MYNIIIVDDEAIVREGIQKKINWEELGLCCVGVCEHGKEALELLEKIHIDIVLTDIYMPFMDGLTLSEHIDVHYPNTKTVILTGHDDFEYARKALKAKVFDYILKPITAKELKTLLLKLTNELDNEKEKQQEIQKLQTLLIENHPLIKGRFLNRVVSGDINAVDMSKKLHYFDISFPGSFFLAAIVDVDEANNKHFFPEDTQSELLCFAVYNICEELVTDSGLGIVFQNQQEQTVILFSGDETITDSVLELCGKIRSILEEKLLFTVTIGLGRVFRNVDDLKISYAEALNALQYRFLLGYNKVIFISEVKEKLNYKAYYFLENEKELLLAIKCNNISHIEQSIDLFMKNIRSANFLPNRCYYVIQQFLFSLEKVFYELELELDELLNHEESFIVEIYKYKTLDEIQLWLCELCKNAAMFLTAQREGCGTNFVLRAEEFIKANYNDGDISINSVCKHLFISISYFSAIFKNATGETFIEYVTKIRMEKAKELLVTSNLKTYEIAHMVGYKDPHYFSASFKKYVGETPTYYRERREVH